MEICRVEYIWFFNANGRREITKRKIPFFFIKKYNAPYRLFWASA